MTYLDSCACAHVAGHEDFGLAPDPKPAPGPVRREGRCLRCGADGRLIRCARCGLYFCAAGGRVHSAEAA
jgi:hypothetical protein